MLRANRLMLAGAVLAFVASPLIAQVKIQVKPIQVQPGQPARIFVGAVGGQKMNLVMRNKKIQEELKFSEEQLKKGKELQQKMQQDRQAAIQLKGQQRIQKLRELQEQASKEFDKILTKEQTKRLDEIQFQQQTRNTVAAVLLRPPFDKKIGVTEEQKAKVQELQKEQQQAIRNLPRNLARDKRQEAVQDIRKKTDEKIRKDVLTKEQNEKIKELSGKPFELPARPGLRAVPVPGNPRIRIRPAQPRQVKPAKPGEAKPVDGKKVQIREIKLNGRKVRVQVVPIDRAKKDKKEDKDK